LKIIEDVQLMFMLSMAKVIYMVDHATKERQLMKVVDP
jgi:hypothetical protein